MIFMDFACFNITLPFQPMLQDKMISIFKRSVKAGIYLNSFSIFSVYIGHRDAAGPYPIKCFKQ